MAESKNLDSEQSTSSDTSFCESSGTDQPTSSKRTRRRTFNDDSIPIFSLYMAPKNKTNFFLVKIRLRNYPTEVNKKEFFEKLLDSHESLECLISAHEDDQYKTNFRSRIRIEMVLDTTRMIPDKYKSTDVFHWINNVLRSFVGPEQKVPQRNELTVMEVKDVDNFPEISIEKARRDRAIKQITERDFDPNSTHFFSNPDNYSENYTIEHWARIAVKKPYDEHDPFLRKPGLNKSREYLKSYYERMHNLLYPKPKIVLKRCNFAPFNDWRDEVISWWNDWIDNGWKPKKKQLFILGEKSNTGKTFFVEQVLLRHSDPSNMIPDELICRPHRSSFRFGWEAVCPEHIVIYLNEFKLENYDMNILKQMLEGDFTTGEQKCKKNSPSIRLKIPAIFVSNNDIPNFIGKSNNRESTEPLRERFKFVRIPSNAKIYTVDDNNPYTELFEKLSTVSNENSSTPVETSSSLQHDEDKESKCGNLSRKLSKLSTQE
jgi:hypothetical protein